MENLYLRYREGFPKDLSRPCIELKDGSIITYKDLEDQSSQYANGFSNLGFERFFDLKDKLDLQL